MEISSNLVESSSNEQTFRFIDGFGPDLVAGPCDIHNTGKLRVRYVPCLPPTVNDEDGKKPNDEENRHPRNSDDNNNNGNGNGHGATEYPKLFLTPQRLKILDTPEPEPNNVCPRTKTGGYQFIICHEGPDSEIYMNGAFIENGIWCTLGSHAAPLPFLSRRTWGVAKILHSTE
ncbi:hypothetical protein MMC07_003325 [Pseudocyphellaria aurata]|nr:hypothetical protein [Pseudocyphellaria aurata]